VAQTVTGFLVMPVLIYRLGDATYGVWIVLGALTSYFGLLDLGIRGAVGRYVALYHANGDYRAMNRSLSGGLAILSLVGGVSVFALIAAQPLFFRVFDIPPELLDTTRMAFQIVAVQFAVYLVGTGFEATLWGLQRFDWLNMLDIPSSILRAVLTVLLIHSAGDLVVLAWITFGVAAVNTLAKAVLCYRADPHIRIGLTYVCGRSVRELLGYGSWALILSTATVTRRQLSPLLIGSLLGLALVAPYSITERLIATGGSLLAAATGVLTPFATALHASDQTDRQRKLFVVGGCHTAAFAVYLLTGLIVLGGSLIALWIGPHFADAAMLVTIIALGELLPSTQHVTNGILLGCARHQSLAVLGLIETVAVCVLTVSLIPSFGLVGAAFAIAIPACLTRGIAPMLYACHLVGVPIGEYVARAIAPPILCGIIPGIAVWFAVLVHPPTSWAFLIAYSVLYTALFVACYVCVFGAAGVKAGYARVAGMLGRRVTKPTGNVG
jgi:O-antigen/teichoic acid export membrane protein